MDRGPVDSQVLKEEGKKGKVVRIRFCSKSDGKTFVEQAQALCWWAYQQ